MAEQDDLKKGETHRVVVLMSDDEVKAIDDWMFANRFRNRSAVIRHFVSMGLRQSAGMAPGASEVTEGNHNG